MIKNAYIHIPFCQKKCKYCVFTSFTDFKNIKSYFNALKTEIEHTYKGEKLNTLYFGGGTPSAVSPSFINKTIELFNFEDDAEITLECNPDDVCDEYVKALKGINRISMGCQTFDDAILKLIGRRHNAAQVVDAVKIFQANGYENISLDFIYGLPNQTVKMFLADLEKAVSLGIKHISLYGLKIEEGSYFAKSLPANLPSIDSQADMFEQAHKFLEGFNHYEISNFAKLGFESKHNLNYWNNNTYYGFGCGASSYLENKRCSNCGKLDEYINAPTEGMHCELITPKIKLEEEIFLGLRKAEGINTQLLREKYNIEFEKEYANVLKKFAPYIIKTQSGFALNLHGMLISNEIMCEFV